MYMMFAVPRIYELGQREQIPLFLCYIDLKGAFDSPDRAFFGGYSLTTECRSRHSSSNPTIPQLDESLRAEQ